MKIPLIHLNAVFASCGYFRPTSQRRYINVLEIDTFNKLRLIGIQMDYTH